MGGSFILQLWTAWDLLGSWQHEEFLLVYLHSLQIVQLSAPMCTCRGQSGELEHLPVLLSELLPQDRITLKASWCWLCWLANEISGSCFLWPTELGWWANTAMPGFLGRCWALEPRSSCVQRHPLLSPKLLLSITSLAYSVRAHFLCEFGVY